jgi:branched-subunit amino acid transport protein
MSLWQAILLAAVGCYLLKLAGMSVPPSLLARPLVSRISGLLPVALLTALVVVQVLGGGRYGVTFDARVIALGVAVVALSFRAPFLVVVFLSAATAAIARMLGAA